MPLQDPFKLNPGPPFLPQQQDWPGLAKNMSPKPDHGEKSYVGTGRLAARVGTSRFEGATLNSTRQPCGMCSMAFIWDGISRIVYGAGRAQVHEMYFEDRHLGLMDYVSDAFKDGSPVSCSLKTARGYIMGQMMIHRLKSEPIISQAGLKPVSVVGETVARPLSPSSLGQRTC